MCGAVSSCTSLLLPVAADIKMRALPTTCVCTFATLKGLRCPVCRSTITLAVGNVEAFPEELKASTSTHMHGGQCPWSMLTMLTMLTMLAMMTMLTMLAGPALQRCSSAPLLI